MKTKSVLYGCLVMSIILFSGCTGTVPNGLPTDTILEPATAAPATETLVPSPTVAPTPTNTQLPTFTPSPLETPTPAAPDISKYTAQPKSFDTFPDDPAPDFPGFVADLTNMKTELRKQPSQLSPDAKPVVIGVLVTDSSSGGKYFTIICNAKGMGTNCAPVAYAQHKESIDGQPRDPHVVVLEMMTKNGIMFFTGIVKITGEIGIEKNYDNFLSHANGPFSIRVVVDSGIYASKYPYQQAIMHKMQPTYQHEAVNITAAGSFSSADENLVFSLGGY